MRKLHAGLCDDDVDQMIQNADLDGDRRISYSEFQGINKERFGQGLFGFRKEIGF